MDLPGSPKQSDSVYGERMDVIMNDLIAAQERRRLLLGELSSALGHPAECRHDFPTFSPIPVSPPGALMRINARAGDSISAAHDHAEQSRAPSPFASTSTNAAAAAAAPADDEEQEECEICLELAPKSEFMELPCAFGHRFMKKCIKRWRDEPTNDRFVYCECPKCRQEFRYGVCGHRLERLRLQSEERGLLVYDLDVNSCMRCRDDERGVRRNEYRALMRTRDWPKWAIFQPGDLFLPSLLERDTPEYFKKAYKEVQDQHRVKIQEYRDEAAQLDRDGLVTDTNEFRRYWQLRSQIADYEWAERYPYGVSDPAVGGIPVVAEDGMIYFDEDIDDEDFEDHYDEDLDNEEEDGDSNDDADNVDDHEDNNVDDDEDYEDEDSSDEEQTES